MLFARKNSDAVTGLGPHNGILNHNTTRRCIVEPSSLSLADIRNVNRFKDFFWARVDRSGGPDACWKWQGTIGRSGYGVTSIPVGHADSKNRMTHRIAWLLTYGEISSLFICHTCDTPNKREDISYRACVNPRHLYLGTAADNARDKVERGRVNHTSKCKGEKRPTAILTEAKVALPIMCRLPLKSCPHRRFDYKVGGR